MAIEKSKKITVRFKPKDYKWLLKKAEKEGMKKSPYIREVVLGNVPQEEGKFSKFDHTRALKDLRKEVHLLGNNLNQIARAANTTGTIDSKRIKDLKKNVIDLRKRILKELILSAKN